jgi:uncharacterized protein YebE (UPF0316 family)
MSFSITPAVLLLAAGIFFLRIGDMSLDTIRMLFVIRGRKALAWGLGFAQSLLFVVAIGSVLSNLNNVFTILAYAAGFATGNVVGMLIEERMAIGYLQFSIISSNRGAVIAERLRTGGHAVTEIPARGKNGTVTMLQTSVKRKDMDNIETIVLEADPEAFITRDEVRPVRRGYWRA